VRVPLSEENPVPEKMRARHDATGNVADVLKNKHYLDNGWVEVDPSTPTTEQEQRRVLNEARRGELNDKPAAEVVAAMESLPDAEREAVVATEKSGKARKTVLNAE
jgi:hypothetical protein